ncbi:hypothetical protein ACHHYP_05686 [Achlya hypogyna]|uniref:Uncharacterized protein n=1 Tax=Achlya hypogyna TaxID=1202772 RepID=A0A1V9YWV1_ACHHY|nr:hypothetical protein ACHHYP_05686 [Achlya hypogyna]
MSNNNTGSWAAWADNGASSLRQDAQKGLLRIRRDVETHAVAIRWSLFSALVGIACLRVRSSPAWSRYGSVEAFPLYKSVVVRVVGPANPTTPPVLQVVQYPFLRRMLSGPKDLFGPPRAPNVMTIRPFGVPLQRNVAVLDDLIANQGYLTIEMTLQYKAPNSAIHRKGATVGLCTIDIPGATPGDNTVLSGFCQFEDVPASATTHAMSDHRSPPTAHA